MRHRHDLAELGQLDGDRARVAGAGRLAKGLWALGLSHDAAPLGRGDRLVDVGDRDRRRRGQAPGSLLRAAR